MRILWIFIALLVVVTMIVVAAGRVGERTPPLARAAPEVPQAERRPPPPPTESPAPAAAAPKEEEEEETAAAPAETAAAPAPVESAEALAAELLASADAATPPEQIAAALQDESTPAPAPAESAAPVVLEPAPAPAPTETASSPPGESASSPGEQLPPAAPAADKAAAPAAVEIVKRDDGSMLVDGKYVMRGAGTREDPYRVTWELLISASQTYRPRLGQTEIPARVQMLHEKYVKITGYLAFPVASSRVEEALVMLNQWDGCCIGVPPSPYDAIEARLSSPYSPRQGHMLRYGTIEGRLKVDPYIVNDWLVGLYLMEEASIEAGL